MEKMNQVSVSEFFAKSKEEMYDMAVEMVEKYNRLVDICNDSAERMADLIERHVKKVDELVIERDELTERHKVYTNALNKDIADKAAKIDLLEKEIEGRKEGYIALKVRMDTKYISIEEHNNICEDFKKKIVKLEKESEKWQDLAKMNRDTICDQYNVCEEFKNKIAEIEEEVEKWKKKFDDSRKETIDRNAKIVKLEVENEKLKVDLIHEREKNEKLAKDYAVQENDIRKYTTEIKTLEEKVKHQRGNLDGINKTLEIRTKENESLIKVRNNLEREIEAHESENARLSEKIKELKRANGIVANITSALTHEEDDYGKSGFKRYIEHLIEEEERAVPERFKERLNKEITEIFTKEEETEIKGNGRTNSGRYPWGAKVNDIPCGSDAIE